MGDIFIDDKRDHRGRDDSDQTRHESLVEALDAFVLPEGGDYVDEAAILAMLILKSSPHHLVWISREGGEEFGQGGENEVFHGGKSGVMGGAAIAEGENVNQIHSSFFQKKKDSLETPIYKSN